MTGATGSIYGLRILETLRRLGGWETHLIVSDAGMLNAWQEYRLARKDIASSPTWSTTCATWAPRSRAGRSSRPAW